MKRKKIKKSQPRNQTMSGNLRVAWKGFVMNARNILTGIGLVWLVWNAMLLLSR